MSIPDLLHAALAEDGARPFVTYYDESTGERIELSVATTANWVAKTANMLQDSLGADGGTTVRVLLPSHWESCVWLLACWSVGCAVTFDTDVLAEVAVVGPGGWTGEQAGEVVALSLRPLGARFADPVPPGVVDFNAEVLGHGDRFVPHEPPGGGTKALWRGSGDVSQDELVAAARADVAERARLLLVGEVDAIRRAEALVAALTVGGSLVLVRHAGRLGDQRRASIVASEQVTEQLT